MAGLTFRNAVTVVYGELQLRVVEAGPKPIARRLQLVEF